MSLYKLPHVLAGALALAGLGCAGERIERERSAIFGGAPAPDDTAVVAVVNFAGGQCSGSLIGPRLVLTARHCVADTAGKQPQVLCGQTEFEDPDSPGAVFVVPRPAISEDEQDYFALSEILLPQGVGPDLCGTDEALLVLKEPLEDITPLTPRLDAAVEEGEPYSAVGFGVDEAEAGQPSGVRKRLDDLQVSCSGASCRMGDVRDNEWVGTGGPCNGDSGGPALDAKGRVVGVVSRGQDGCTSPVFGDLPSRAPWLKSEARRIAQAHREESPEWAPCLPEDGCIVEAPPADDADEALESSCALSQARRSRHAGSGFWPALLFGLALGRRSAARLWLARLLRRTFAGFF